MSAPGYRLGYNTNGFAHHRLDDALRIIAELGYGAVALTPDANHLPPDRATSAEVRELRTLLEQLGLSVVVETGARYVLDPRRKHWPTLVDADAGNRARRLAFLERCAQIAAELGGDTVSLWSGVPTPGVDPGDAHRHLVDGLSQLCARVAPLGVQVALEPEPGMLVETLTQWETVRDAVGAPNLGLALDVGHVPVSETVTVGTAIRRYGDVLRTVHLDDTRNGVHEHLQVGDGELDWNDVARALAEVGFSGIAAFELSRHSHAAPQAASDAITRFTAITQRAAGR